MNLDKLLSFDRVIGCFICDDSIFSFGAQLTFLKDTIATNSWQINYSILERALPIVALGLPVSILILLHRWRWLSFILGIISFVIPMRLFEFLECLDPARYCSVDNFETGVDCAFQWSNVTLVIIYNTVVISLVLSVSNKSKRRNRH